MELGRLMVRAVGATVEVVRGVGPETLDRPTPCAEYAVRALVTTWTRG